MKFKIVEDFHQIDNLHQEIIVDQNPRQYIRVISQIIVVNISTISDHPKITAKMAILDKWVPHKRSEGQKVREEFYEYQLDVFLFFLKSHPIEKKMAEL